MVMYGSPPLLHALICDMNGEQKQTSATAIALNIAIRNGRCKTTVITVRINLFVWEGISAGAPFARLLCWVGGALADDTASSVPPAGAALPALLRLLSLLPHGARYL